MLATSAWAMIAIAVIAVLWRVLTAPVLLATSTATPALQPAPKLVEEALAVGDEDDEDELDLYLYQQDVDDESESPTTMLTPGTLGFINLEEDDEDDLPTTFMALSPLRSPRRR